MRLKSLALVAAVLTLLALLAPAAIGRDAPYSRIWVTAPAPTV
jgi:hypothetical protein